MEPLVQVQNPPTLPESKVTIRGYVLGESEVSANSHLLEDALASDSLSIMMLICLIPVKSELVRVLPK